MNRFINGLIKYSLIIIVSIIILLLTLAVIDRNTSDKGSLNGVGGKINESRLIGKQLPPFTIYDSDEFDENLENKTGAVVFDTKSVLGRAGMINFFASWCIPCILEHPMLTQLQNEGLDIYGIVFNDTAEEIDKYLVKYGNPYESYGYDPKGRSVVEFGLTGIPQSYLYNKEGRIVYVVIGPITKEVLEDNILPLISEF